MLLECVASIASPERRFSRRCDHAYVTTPHHAKKRKGERIENLSTGLAFRLPIRIRLLVTHSRGGRCVTGKPYLKP